MQLICPKSALTVPEKRELMTVIHSHKTAFSLRDEIGECPNLCVSINVVDDSPFFVRPFPIAENDKPIMDRQMNRLVGARNFVSQHNQSYLTGHAHYLKSDT